MGKINNLHSIKIRDLYSRDLKKLEVQSER